MNHIFKPGDQATYTVYTDAHAGYISRVSKSGRKVWFREGHAKLLNGATSGEPDALKFSPGGFVGHTSGVQRWEITPNDKGEEMVFTLRHNGLWKAKGHGAKSPGCSLAPGHHHHYDFNF